MRALKASVARAVALTCCCGFCARPPGDGFSIPSWSFLGRSKGEIDWALQYLVREGQVESRLTELPARKPVLRYLLRLGSTPPDIQRGL